mmetsp:Transcript_33842/g.61367  ORF Transcript_33842/g.61367 Transcript_33842/m.61367 type:complete len:202 (+) Transcript_33842:74-679(+)
MLTTRCMLVCVCLFARTSAAVKVITLGACQGDETPQQTGCDDLDLTSKSCEQHYTGLGHGSYRQCKTIGSNCLAATACTSAAAAVPTYVLAPAQKTWQDCSSFCATENAQVVIPESADEVNSKIKPLLPVQNNMRVWLGIEKPGGSGNWKPTPSWTNWQPGGEGNQRETNAGIIWQAGWDGTWYDMNPGSRVHYCVCKSGR